MRKSDRVLAAGIAAIVWLVAGYAIASRPMAPQARTPSSVGGGAGPAAGGLRTAFL